MGPRAEPILLRTRAPPSLRPGRLATVLRGRGAQPGPTARGLGRGGLRGSPGLGDRGLWPLGHSPVRDAFATPANHRFQAYWTRADDAFAQPWDYATTGPLWANSPLSRLEKEVAKAAWEGCLMLIIAPEWPGPQYPWWAALCALCPKRWQLPQDRPVYLRGGART